ncbi:hypothetical protein Xmau_03803 [Xenorhabdus mauleonii]|uniref:Uncharacterized protein n=1 Tax=Xenorhabdus mauleonii TaxID=351675 RepID=A0A1I3V4D1_9GAMM|nr:hypothetical protein [Xenorhabdus mauleonii]PHM37586.1 hypothetical protein Xmau_03803 [Xenorhabdus mauleonii]SFJ88981.1 hypothetical protein SAMN05421680_1198 [Xenorhabdus mauleonii]
MQHLDQKIRQFLKAVQDLKSLEIIDDIDNLTLSQLQEMLLKQSNNGTRLKQQFLRHGAKWELEEEGELKRLFSIGELNVGEFANKYQRRPKSVKIRMIKLGLIDQENS